ncbi:MAG TPA: DUF3891 family protein [Actinomycetota bacterium]
MIFQRRGGGLLAVTQPDHGRLAGLIAGAWGGAAWRPEPWGPVKLSAHHHDDGWAAWEESPTLHPDGRPVDFLTLAAPERVEIYRRSVDMVAGKDLYAGMLTSLHVTGLFLGRYTPGHGRAIDQLGPDDHSLVSRFVAEQEAWRQQVATRLDASNLWAQYHVLQVFDMLSLTLCMRADTELEGLSFDRVPFEAGEAPIAMGVRRAGDRLVLRPWPLEAGEVTVGVDARALPATRFPDVGTYRQALRAAPVTHLEFRLVRGNEPANGTG